MVNKSVEEREEGKVEKQEERSREDTKTGLGEQCYGKNSTLKRSFCEFIR